MTRKAAIGWGLSIASALCSILAACAFVASKTWPEIVFAGATAASTALAALAGAWGKWGE
jgi:hypothetical protein